MRQNAVLRPIAVVASSAACLGLSACVAHKKADLIDGKTAFIAKCASCHTLARANAKGLVGPNLDQAFVRSVEDGMKRSTIEGVVRRQIEEPNRRPQEDPQTLRPGTAMPKNLVGGDQARDVAAYVAYAAARPGKDAGRLATVGPQISKAAATEKGGTLDIPVDPSGALAYQFGSATAQAGAITINSKNAQSTGHNIAIEGPGVDQKGQIVSGGATSTIKLTLKPGTYTFYCSVPGHREAGMQGKLTVK